MLFSTKRLLIIIFFFVNCKFLHLFFLFPIFILEKSNGKKVTTTVTFFSNNFYIYFQSQDTDEN